MLLSDQIKALCKEHELTSIGINYHAGTWGDSFTVYAHWDASGGKCSSAHGDTPEIALSKAVAEADAVRGRGVVAVAPMELAA